MAEARREDEEEEERADRRDVPYRNQATAHPERTKPDHSSRGPLNSIPAAVRRTSTTSKSDHTRERRRPEITILSAQPLASNLWFSGNPAVSPHAPQSGWSAGIQAVPQPPPSYERVIQEKTHEENVAEHVAKPAAPPRRTARTATSATQTDIVSKDTCAAAPQPSGKRPAGEKPRKPPRPSLPKPVDRRPVGANPRVPRSGEEPSERPGCACGGSVTVHWDFPLAAASAQTAPSPRDPEPRRHPVPLPRTKPRKQAVARAAPAKVQTLVELREHCDGIRSDPDQVPACEYLKEPSDNECERNRGDANRSEEASQREAAGVEMNGSVSQRSIRARIQALETQSGSGEGNAADLAQAGSAFRQAVGRPPVAAKPSVSPKPQFNRGADYRSASFRDLPKVPEPSPGPVKEELETLFNKRSPSVLAKANSIHGEGARPSPAVKSFKEALKPNFNINNHNSTSTDTENLYSDSSSNHVPFKPQHGADINGGPSNRQSLTRRPTTIRVPSFPGSPNYEAGNPPLPPQKPNGSQNPSGINRQSQTPTFSHQESFPFGPEPSLPPRRLSTSKTLPPRPPLAKTAPVRPTVPNMQGIGRSQSLYLETPPKPQSQRRRSVLPPRPKPGHSLYNKYTLQLPHGIAAFDYDGSDPGELSFQKNEVLLLLDEIDHNAFQCQIGESKGQVQKAHMVVITPLSSFSDTAPPQDAGSGEAGSELRVQATHDFDPEGAGELGLRAGDVVTMVEQLDSQWYTGTCRGSTGFFPISYVKVLSNSPKPPREQKARPSSTTVSGPRCVAKFDFEGKASDDELSFSEGDVIQLKAYVGEDWARGRIGASTGLVPLNFVEVIEDLPPATSLQKRHSAGIAMPGMVSSASTQARAAELAQSGVEWATALYDYAGVSDGDLSFERGDRILVSRHMDADWGYGRLGGREGAFPRAYVESGAAGQQSNNQQSGAAGGRGRAMFDFTPESEEELCLQAGDIITGLEAVDGEWFLGELRGKRALVPRNYVQVLE